MTDEAIKTCIQLKHQKTYVLKVNRSNCTEANGHNSVSTGFINLYDCIKHAKPFFHMLNYPAARWKKLPAFHFHKSLRQKWFIQQTFFALAWPVFTRFSVGHTTSFSSQPCATSLNKHMHLLIRNTLRSLSLPGKETKQTSKQKRLIW